MRTAQCCSVARTLQRNSGIQTQKTHSVSAIASEKTAIYYGDMSGLAVKTSEDVSIQILNEKYATQHAVGVIAWVEIDAKVENAQKIAALKMKKAGG